MSDFPTFDEWYGAINPRLPGGDRRTPFPWQSRLARRLAEGEGWPDEIGVQTGLGKTACLDIAIWWLASQASQPASERTAPTRIWWLVNRRLLVDATAEHAANVANRLANDRDEDPAVRSVADRLRQLSASDGGDPLEVVRLRGGAATGRPTDPSQPAVILSTIPMYGSRLLFRGYGSSRSMRPIDAALAGTDALVLVDEAHLARHLMDLFEPLAACDRSTVDVLPPNRRRPTVVSLTATGSSEAEPFRLDYADLAHPIVQQRLHAAKPLRIVEGAKRDKGAALLTQQTVSVLDASEGPTSCVVFVNSPATAREVAKALSATPPRAGATVYVATGRQRKREAELVRKVILDPASGVRAGAKALQPTDSSSSAPGPEDPTGQQHLVVVATQTLEVGADLDFQHLVTEACGVRSLTQRLGRLNRLGEHDGATATYVHLPPPADRDRGEDSWPVYGTEPTHVLARIQAAVGDDGTVSMSPAEVSTVLGPPDDDPGRAPAVMPELLWEWAKTTNPPWGEAPVEPYFSGLSHPERMVTVCWRAWLPELPPPDGGSERPPPRIWPRVTAAETIDVPLTEAREVLRPVGAAPDEVVRVWILSADRSSLVPVDAAHLRAGTTIILPSSAGFYDEDGWSPASRIPVPDVVLQHHGLPLDADLLTSGLGDMRSTRAKEAGERIRKAIRTLTIEGEEEKDETAMDGALKELREGLMAGGPPTTVVIESDGDADTEDLAPWAAFLEGLVWDHDRLVRSPDGSVRLIREKETSRTRLDELDELSAEADEAVLLDHHGLGVGRRAGAIADRVGLGPVAATVTMAGELHDLGKADERFQRWLASPDEAGGALLAKSTGSVSDWQKTRAESGWPRGGRHEMLSARLVETWIASGAATDHPDLDLDLLLHLVVSHHGHARPFLVPVSAPDHLGSIVSAVIQGHEVNSSADLSVADWDQPARFRSLSERYGHWGLALLEATVRQADHAVSSTTWVAEKTEVA